MINSKNIFCELKKLIKNSRADFSKFKVAAIIKTDKGYFSGVNFEDPILNLGICAERNAIFNGITNGMKKISEVHLLTSDKKASTMPCGACRQVISNLATKNCKVFIYNLQGEIQTYSIEKLLPFSKIGL